MRARPLLPFLLTLSAIPALAAAGEAAPAIPEATARATALGLVETHGAQHAERIQRGVRQVADRWWPEDGDADAFAAFCAENFLTSRADLDRAADRLEVVAEQVDGHLHEIRREIMTPLELDTGPVQTVDRLLSRVDLSAHVGEDLFRAHVPFYFLLNFPVHTLAERLTEGAAWNRRIWAHSRMMERFEVRVPADVSQQISRAFSEASQYIDGYNVRMDRLVTPDGRRLFPDGLRLITHWGLRDELKSQYAEGADGLERQRAILRVMQRIVRQEIPAEVIDSEALLWAPESNAVWTHQSGDRGTPRQAPREPDTRYERLLAIFHAVRRADRYAPNSPTYIARVFEQGRQIPEAVVEALLVSVLTSDEFQRAGGLIRRRLGRQLEPFDIWYDGFKPRGAINEAELDRIVAERYPSVDAFQQALPTILRGLGFAADKAAWLAEHIVVDPSRGAGHASGAARREDQAHLRTRVGPGGMDYKGYNIAIHELGHNVEQVFSLNSIDHWWLNGVPNTAFTEALAFTFQARDLELLGLAPAAADAAHTEALDTLWNTAEIGGVALVDMAVWRWMYAHPGATAAELREATLAIARDVWNRYYAPVFGVRDSEVLAIYSHMIAYGLYLPDYPLGHIIAFQVAARMRAGDFGAEFERVSRQGRLTPDAWMRGAVGGPISADALLAEARKALGP